MLIPSALCYDVIEDVTWCDEDCLLLVKDIGYYLP